MNIKSRLDERLKRYGLLAFIAIAIGIIAVVIFKYPQMGVADQGDFDRVMSGTGLSLLDSDLANQNGLRFYDYIVTDYKINPDSYIWALLASRTSMNYIILFINFICSLLGQEVFRTQYLAIVYSFIYIFSFASILKLLNIKGKIKNIIASILILLVFFDGNYLIWFNSLYGEPMMISSLVLFITSLLYYVKDKYVDKKEGKLQHKILYVFLAAIILMASKFQLVTSLPFILFLVGKIFWDNRKILNKKYRIIFIGLLCLMIIIPLRASKVNADLSRDTQYNSVFYGVLNGSEDPEQDLIDLGLNPDMASEAGKHAYLDEGEYEKYIPRMQITEQEFYNKINNGKLAVFYLSNPQRLYNGMEYTASKAFSTSTSLGKCYIDDSVEPVKENYNRFTLWSKFREEHFPTKIWFIIAIYLCVFGISLFKYIKEKNNEEIKIKIIMLWIIMLIGAIQFPMPFIGNGQADTSKQLYLFNFIFDGLIVLLVGWICSKVISLLSRLRKNKSQIREKLFYE